MHIYIYIISICVCGGVMKYDVYDEVIYEVCIFRIVRICSLVQACFCQSNDSHDFAQVPWVSPAGEMENPMIFPRKPSIDTSSPPLMTRG